MRDYSKVAPQFWIGETGKRLRGHPEAQIVALYLITNPHANMLGLYYLPRLFIAHETGLSAEGASEGLSRCIEAMFCGYDDSAEVVWIFEMARFQVGAALKADDKRCIGVQNDYDAMPRNRFLSEFFDKYAGAFHLTRKRENETPDGSPSEAPPKPLRSQEQEQEQEQEREQEQKRPLAVAGEASPKKTRKPAPHVAIFEEEARAAGLTPAVAEADAIQLAQARKKFPDDDGFRAGVRRYFQMQDKFLVENRWAGRFIGSRLQALLNPGKTSDTAFPPTKPVGTKYADTPTVRL